MKQLSVDAVGFINDQDSREIQLQLKDDGFSWNSIHAEPIFVKYSHIQRYGTCTCQRGNIATQFLYVQCRIHDGVHISPAHMYVDVADEDVLDGLLEFLLEHVDVDPSHISGMFTIPKNECNETECIASRISNVFVKTYVTFLQFVGKSVLAGVGDHLQVFSKDCNGQWKLLQLRQIFQGQNIHGFQIGRDNYMVVYGGREIAVLKLCSSGIRKIYSFQAPDWVLDCVWLEGKQIALLTANNSVVLYNLTMHGAFLKMKYYCCERCILYSGIILGNNLEDIVVLAGTVFSTITIWLNAGDSQKKEIIHRLEGHNGVIFSITYSHEFKRICSTSDDRSLRVWDVHFRNPGDWKTCTIHLKFTLYGHSARVWRSLITDSGKIISVGEDSRVCLWNSEGTLETQYTGHQDGEVWSLAASEELQLIATGGSDGGINLWHMKKTQVPHELGSCNDNLKPKCVGLSSGGQPFMVSWKGDVFLFSDAKWKLCFSEPELKSYCLHAIAPDRKRLVFGSITGRLIICRLDVDSISKETDVIVCDGRIYSLTWITLQRLVVCGQNGRFAIWSISDNLDVFKEKDFILPPSKERWVTSCAADDTYVVCGDRSGSLYLYLREGTTNDPVYTCKKIHGQNGVTDVKNFNGKFVSTGRDGTFRVFIVEHDELVTLRCSKLKLNWVAAVNDSDLLGQVLFCFHDMAFIIWSIKDRQEMLKLDCGGGHRSWDCAINSDKRQIFMTFIKGKTVKFCCIPVEDIVTPSLLPGNHPKAINSGDIVDFPSDGGKVALLAGEDTTLRLVSFHGIEQMEHLVLQQHLSSVRVVTCHKSFIDDTMYIASGGGRGQLVFWKVRCLPNESLSRNNIDVVVLNSHFVIPQSKDDVYCDAAEMRIMDLQIYQLSRDSVLIAAGCSDGVLRVFSYAVDSHCITEVQSIAFQNCLLKVCVCCNGLDTFLIVTTTSGSLFFFDILNTGLLVTNAEQRFLISETGLNSCDYCKANENVLVGCGGDDSQVNLILFKKETDSFKLADRWICNAAHTCQVSGLKIIDNLMFSVALDQKLSVYSWTVIGNKVNVAILQQINLCIPDIHGLLVWPNAEDKSYSVLVYGIGTQRLTFSNNIFANTPSK